MLYYGTMTTTSPQNTDKKNLPTPVDFTNLKPGGPDGLRRGLSRLTVESKAHLARMMASEGITVEHQATAQTAAFDAESRRLILPVWDNMTEDMYDLLVGHEVGHALFTPRVNLDKAAARIDSNPANSQIAAKYLNIVEDQRIERMMCERFPGLKNAFCRGYTDMYNQGRVIPPGMDVAEMGLIDRINILGKLGRFTNITEKIPMNDEEMALFHRCAAAKSIEEACEVAREIYDYAREMARCKMAQIGGTGVGNSTGSGKQNSPQKGGGSGKGKGKTKPGNNSQTGNDKSDSGNSPSEEKRSQEQTPEDLSAGDDVGNTPSTPSDESKKKEQPKDNSSSGSNGKNNDEDSEETEDKKDSSAAKSSTNNEPNNLQNDGELAPAKEIQELPDEAPPPPDSVTHDHIQKSVHVLANRNGKKTEQIDYIDIGDGSGMNNVLDYKKCLEEWRGVNNSMRPPSSVLQNIVSEFQKSNKPGILALGNMFDQRKAADAHRRTSHAKSGVLDIDKICGYKFNEDLFRRMAVVKDGKSHGIVMFIDWSSSMTSVMKSTIYQLLQLTGFCRQAGIPYEVYAFSDGHPFRKGITSKSSLPTAMSYGYSVALLNILSSRMNLADYAEMSGNLLCFGSLMALREGTPTDQDRAMSSYTGMIPNGWYLHGTPLNGAVVAAFDIVPEFKKRTGVQIINTIVLTDGEGTDEIYNTSRGYSSYSNRRVFRDTKTHVQIDRNDVYEEGPHKTQKDVWATTTDVLVSLLRYRTGGNTIGFYLIGNSRGATILANMGGVEPGSEKAKAMASSFKENKFAALDNRGYTTYFVIPDLAVQSILDTGFNPTVKTFKSMATKFGEYLKRKKTNRIVLGRFIDLICKEMAQSFQNDAKATRRRVETPISSSLS